MCWGPQDAELPQAFLTRHTIEACLAFGTPKGNEGLDPLYTQVGLKEMISSKDRRRIQTIELLRPSRMIQRFGEEWARVQWTETG